MDYVATANAPAAIGPYSQAIIAGKLIYTAGQIPLDPATMEMVGSNVTEQTEQVFKNLKAVLEEAGAGLGAVVKTTVFLADMADFPAVNSVYGGYFADAPPARSTVEVGALPGGFQVEIEAIATR